ncbi:vascular endothelial growth factor receptor 1 isoform X1 [Drosophila teissieri]|uniref:vascular endothelial growth factor receptor 1 isoform X1 n=1 Tax=Drosophila teissieri TaxID=7243 RepID=UPI001CBA03D2|nr:vascular endothelial growth factor receptor 1 isoform X1 [Drosophila teissieri]XP_043641417.1 vascular endothelial growth factor receptor 1 isoform X1 [Drosophila teissieri]
MAMLKGLFLLPILWIMWSDALPLQQFTPDPDDSTENCGGENGAPLMTPCKSAIILDAATSTTLKCEDNEPMTWWTSSSQAPLILPDSFSNTEDPARPYGTSLQLNEVTAEYVAAYYCVKDSKFNEIPHEEQSDEAMIELVNQGYASSIYVYVNDPDNKLVDSHNVVTARQYSDVVIPCKPSMPDTEVVLETSNGDMHSSKSVGRYDPQRGFTIEIRSIVDGGDYYCRPNPPFPHNEEEMTSIEVRFIESGLELPTNMGYTTYAQGVTDGDDEVLNVTNQSTGNVALILDGGDGSLSGERARRSPARLAPMNASPSPRPGQDGKPLPKPVIRSSVEHHVFTDTNFTLDCEQSAYVQSVYGMEWFTPTRDENRIFASQSITDPKTRNSTHQTGRSTLTVLNAQPTDTGLYKCVTTDTLNQNVQRATYRIKVLKHNESYLNVGEPSGHYNVQEYANRTIQMTANFEGFPTPTFSWFKPDGAEVRQSENNFKILSTELSTMLQVLNAQLQDSGTYVLRGSNSFGVVQREYNVSVMDAPALKMSDAYVQVGSVARLECTVRSYPPAIVTFFFRPCSLEPRWPTCSVLNQNFSLPSEQEKYQFQTRPRPGKLSVERIYEVSFLPTEPGILTCIAQNIIDGKERRTLTKAHVLLGNISSNMTIYGFDKDHKIAKEDNVNFTCEALAYHFDGNLKWFLNGEDLKESDLVRIETSHTKYSYKSTVHIATISDRDRGTYECRAFHNDNDAVYSSQEIDLYVHDPSAPQWTVAGQEGHSKIKRKLSQTLELECASTAVPVATVRWFKDDKELSESKLRHFIEKESKLLITHLYPGDEGVYKCVVENRLDRIERSFTVVISDLPGISMAWVWFGVILFLILISLCLFLAVRYQKEHKRHLALKAAGLANFEEGAVGHINPDLTLDEQAELLPYNREFEFPRDSLKLGKQLGAGAFGVVLKGEARGIRREEPTTTVAVKMVKATADNEVVRALVSELKIMVHLGQHLNVVNLLGAVTKNIAKRELMVIVEYCRFGNIQNFLLRNRKCFINQINPDTDHIDTSIMTQRMSDNYDLHRETNGGGLKYANVGFPIHSYINEPHNNNTQPPPHRRNSDNDPRSGTRAGRTGSGSATYSYDRQMDTCATVMTTVPEDDQIMSNNSVQPAWRSNYKTDSTEAMTVTTVDLISWAFQVARGMDYLSSKKVLHGDLAARNILLCEDNVVKICDFGLARSMYRGDNYKKSESGKLPIKWLALESLSDHVFSTYSDVWSYGIVLWEMFSLAKVPYPGIDPNQELFNKLNDGYRMEKPKFANQELYEIMLECWRKNPESRPLFAELEKRFGNMLGEDVASHYLDLNNPYMQSNVEYMKKQSTDYLALMGSPDELAPAAPRYVNGHIVPDIRIEELPDDYMAMSPDSEPDASTAIFSPTRLEGETSDFPDFSSETTFNFPGARQSPTLSNNLNSGSSKPLRKKNGMPTVDVADQAPEEIPMLHRRSTESDESPEQGRRFNQALKQQYVTPTPSPRHHVETKLNGESSENYVNVKPPRKNIPGKTTTGGGGGGAGASTEAFSNPSYQPLSTVNEKEQRRY